MSITWAALSTAGASLSTSSRRVPPPGGSPRGEDVDLPDQGDRGQGAADGGREQQAENRVSREEDDEDQGQPGSAGKVEDRRCRGNETAHGRDRSTGGAARRDKSEADSGA